ncbi:MAG: hypothetical protein IPI35_28250 [Deltaproteobacteria bacterium]|nr:hypothetical protein [Deltaproteobacteria bacterium]
MEEAAAAWSEALSRRGLTVHPVSPIPNDHPALPNTLTVTFEGDAIVRARALPTRGSVRITRTGWDQVEATWSWIPLHSALGAQGPASLSRRCRGGPAALGLERWAPAPAADTLLGDPARCLARVAEFEASPIPEAKEALRLGLETTPKLCQRAILTVLLRDPAMKAPVSAWIVGRYHAAPAEERAHYAALGLGARARRRP